MRLIKGFYTSQIRLLTRIHKETRNIISINVLIVFFLAIRGFSELAKIFRKTQRAIYSWLELWETYHFVGLVDHDN